MFTFTLERAYCKFRIFREGFIFAKLRISSQNAEMTVVY